MKFSDIVDGRLHVTRIKTGMKIAFPYPDLEARGYVRNGYRSLPAGKQNRFHDQCRNREK